MLLLVSRWCVDNLSLQQSTPEAAPTTNKCSSRRHSRELKQGLAPIDYQTWKRGVSLLHTEPSGNAPNRGLGGEVNSPILAGCVTALLGNKPDLPSALPLVCPWAFCVFMLYYIQTPNKTTKKNRPVLE